MFTWSKGVIGTTTGPRTFEYSWRDMILYNLGVGAQEDEPQYLYEKNLQMIPSFVTVPYWGTFGILPSITVPSPVVVSLGNITIDMAHEFILYQPLSPLGAKLTFENVITNVYNRSDGKGAIIRTKLTAYDEKENKVFTNTGDHYARGYAIPGADPFPRSSVIFPETKPDTLEKCHIPGHQAFLYRLSGDVNIFHVDADEAAKYGYEKPIIQGLCTYGYGCRMAIKALIPGEAIRVKRFGAQLRFPLWPGTDVEIQVWRVNEQKALMRMIDLSTGKIVLDNGWIEWE